MSNFTVSPVAAINGNVATLEDQLKLGLKTYGQEVMKAFMRSSETKGRYMEKTISSGKSAQFPAFGRKEASYHTRGQFLTGTDLNANERIINLDGNLISDSTIDNFEEAVAHYDVREPHTSADGEAIALAMDTHMYATLLQEARNATANVDGSGGAPSTGTGSSITNAAALTDAAVIQSLFFEAGTKFDNNYVPQSNRMAHLTPGQVALLVELAPRAIHKDFNGQGSVESGKIMQLNGFEIIKSVNWANNVVGKNIVASDPRAKYGVDATNSASLFTHKSAAGS
jgi:hypothetical protein